ncbi:MAG: DUF262 domain-containing HNH endonuclease family protein [Burkholderiaceae bacterium]|nr:DUF262 domain-containing HNH endonuclease family protein [Burkholderiaceae bacterium]
MSEQIFQRTVQELLGEGVSYLIPIYQRNYAWGEAEITQLIQDVIDYLPKCNAPPQNYYIGTLVVFERLLSGGTVFETIDGQQRLTTLSLLVSHLRNSGEPGMHWYEALRIRFESRARSQKTFAAIFAGAFEQHRLGYLAPHEINESIANGYRLIQQILPRKLADNGVNQSDFTRYLFNHVVLMRVSVPPQTDLNHYFEIMNSRGEQLEKHEVLKARMMDALSDDTEPERSRQCLHAVWEACANMERYVQMGFTPAERDAIFGKGDWGGFEVDGFKQLCEVVGWPQGDSAREGLTLDAILGAGSLVSGNTEDTQDEMDDTPERFHSVINFPNFLLHVLRVMTREDVSLDDKALISTFDTYLFKAGDPVAMIKAFVFALLRCKYLFDQFVIKREFAKAKDGWSLKRCKWSAPGEKRGSGKMSYVNTFGTPDLAESDPGNRRILMLLSAFHVSTPTLVYKHWLNAALKHLYDAPRVEEGAYLRYLESVAKAFVFDRHLAGENKAQYYDIVYQRDGECHARHGDFPATGQSVPGLSYGELDNNLIFNFLDYRLWVELRNQDDKVRDFEFTFRSSVEHFYPQNPIEGQTRLAPSVLDAFGNLCLISHSKNSRLSNLMPRSKTEYYQNNRIDSIKQHLMMKAALQHQRWDAEIIAQHGEKMVRVLVNSLDA